MNRILAVCIHQLQVIGWKNEWTHSNLNVPIPYIYKARNTLSPYPESWYFNWGPTSEGLALFRQWAGGVCFKLGLGAALSALLFYAPVTLASSQAFGILAAGFPPPEVNDDWRFYLVTLYSSVSCTLWWCQMAARTNPTPCSEVSVVTSRKLMGAGAVAVGIFLIISDSQRDTEGHGSYCICIKH